MHRFTLTQITYLIRNHNGLARAELTEMFNQHFDLQLKQQQIENVLQRWGLRSGYGGGQFRPGHIPHNKGKRKFWTGGEATQFKKGHKPWNYKPVGTERINANGYVDVKVADPNKWRQKHLLIWEEAHGPVPKGQVIIFADGNCLNVQLDNLLLVSRRELVMLNKYSLIGGSAELTKVGITVADLHLKAGERKRKAKRKGGEIENDSHE